MDLRSPEIQASLKELVKLITRREDVPEGVLEHATRLLRPSTGVHEHAGAIKQRIRQSILANTVTGRSGPAVVADFERECEVVRRVNPALLQSFLAVVEPLGYSVAFTVPRTSVGTMDNKAGTGSSNASGGSNGSGSLSHESKSITGMGSNSSHTSSSHTSDSSSSMHVLHDLPGGVAPTRFTGSVGVGVADDAHSRLSLEPSRTTASHRHHTTNHTSVTAWSARPPSVRPSSVTTDDLMPIVPPYHTTGVDPATADAVRFAWVDEETEVKLLRDLIFIFQVRRVALRLMGRVGHLFPLNPPSHTSPPHIPSSTLCICDCCSS